MKTAIYPGSFDPVTLGHLNIIKRAAQCFDRVIVCVMVNSKKHGLFTPEERVELLERCTARFPNVEVDFSDELLAAYLPQLHRGEGDGPVWSRPGGVRPPGDRGRRRPENAPGAGKGE